MLFLPRSRFLVFAARVQNCRLRNRLPRKHRPESNRLEPLVDLLLEIPDPAVRLDVLKGMQQAIKGQRDLPMPAKWPKARKELAKSPSQEVRKLARSLSLIFGDPQAMQSLRELIANDKAPLAERKAAIADLAQVRDKKLLPILQKQITDPELSEAALRGLAAYNAPDTPVLILKHYARFTPEGRQSALFYFGLPPVLCPGVARSRGTKARARAGSFDVPRPADRRF